MERFDWLAGMLQNCVFADLFDNLTRFRVDIVPSFDCNPPLFFKIECCRAAMMVKRYSVESCSVSGPERGRRCCVPLKFSILTMGHFKDGPRSDQQATLAPQFLSAKLDQVCNEIST